MTVDLPVFLALLAASWFAGYALVVGALWVLRRRPRAEAPDDLTALADTVLVDQAQEDARFAAIAAMEPDVTALGRAIAADLYCTEEDS